MGTTADPQGPPGSGGREHPDVDRLAELDEGLLDSEAARALTAHVAGCDACTAAMGRVRDVRAALRALPDVTMPEEVAARLRAAIAAEDPPAPAAAPAATVLRPHRRTAGWLPALAAAVAFLGVAGGVGYLWSSGGSGSGENASSAGANTAAGRGASAPSGGTVVNHSGTHYTSESLRAAAPALIGAKSSNEGAAPAASSAQSFAADHAVPQALAPLTAQTDVLACAHNTGYDRAPLGVDYAYYDGQPRLIMIFPAAGDASRLVIVVAQPDCATNANALFTTLFVSR